jgi:hypothetical protein
MNTDTQDTELVQTAVEMASVERAEIDMQIATAKRYPRQLSVVKQSMLSFATLDQDTAMACFYKLPRGGKMIEGPSVRLAEIALSCYGNMRVASRIVNIQIDGEGGAAVVEAVAFDLQNNTAVRIEKRRRITKKRNKPAPDDDDINLAVNAGSAIALRDAVFKVVPMALIKPVLEAAKRTAIGDQKTLGERRVKAVELFVKMGVKQERVFARIEKKGIDDVTLEDLETLLGLYTGIKDGNVSIDEAFPEPVVTTSAPSFANAPKPSETPAQPKPASGRVPTKKEQALEFILERKAQWPALQQLLTDEQIEGADSAATADDFCNGISENAAAWIVAQRAVIDSVLNKKGGAQ